MPTVLSSGPYRCYFYSSDFPEPPHSHVRRDHMRAKVWLMPVRVDWCDGFGASEVGRIERLVEENQELLLRRWYEYFTR